MRGKEPVVLLTLRHGGITPAYAGKSVLDPFRHRCRHGSPPPMRGKVPVGIELNFSVGITPAYAGKRPHGGFFCKSLEDHPRLCGEKNSQTAGVRSLLGSPPPMRGKVHTSSSVFELCGITPAYAGKSSAFVRDFGLCKDHPRLCGEKVELLQSRRRYAGSPPPMRGKAVHFRSGRSSGRITPAYAGKRDTVAVLSPCTEDHPRLCGEKAGSTKADLEKRGITPAYAGKSPAHLPARHLYWGSPPPMRGKGREKSRLVSE